MTLNILLSFAQFERELVSKRTQDKIAMARAKGKYAGGRPVLGYDAEHVTRTTFKRRPAHTERVRSLALPRRSGGHPSR